MRNLLALMLGLSIVVHFGFLYVGLSLLPNWRWSHYAVHSSMEMLGAVIALWCAWKLIEFERRSAGTSCNVCIAGALAGMGLLDGLHALCHVGNNFVWLHSTATFVGGILFALVWLPSNTFARRCWWPLAVATGILLLGATSFAVPSLVPQMVENGLFTAHAKILNVVGGSLMLAAAGRLVWSYWVTGNNDDLLFCLHCTLFGMSAIMFEQSKLWDLPWWGWHVLRLAAYGFAMFFIYENDPEHELAKANEEIRRHRDELEATVRERTATLSEKANALELSETHLKEQSENLARGRLAALNMFKDVEVARQRSLKAEAIAREQAARLQGIVDSATDAIITINPKGIIVSFNAAAEQIFGYRVDEAIGENVKMLMPAPYQTEHDGYLSKYLKTGVKKIIGIGREAVGRRKDGNTFAMEISVSEVQLDDRRLFTGIVRDITERKASEKKQQELIQEIERKSAQIAAANVNLERSNEELKQFAYVASHDLQEPLRKVNSFCQMLRDEYSDQLDNDAKTYIRYAVDGATRMRSLVSDLLDYSRVETQGKPFVPSDVGDACTEAIENLQSSIDESKAQITVGPLPVIMADRSQVVRLFQNLIGNAIKYRSAERPEIQIAAEDCDDEWMISIRDNGIGMESQFFERIFVMFQRLHARNEYSGTGIGLAICKRIVDRLNGRIWVESELGAGSTFFLSVPKRTIMPLEGTAAHEHSHPVYAKTH